MDALRFFGAKLARPVPRKTKEQREWEFKEREKKKERSMQLVQDHPSIHPCMHASTLDGQWKRRKNTGLTAMYKKRKKEILTSQSASQPASQPARAFLSPLLQLLLLHFAMIRAIIIT